MINSIAYRKQNNYEEANKEIIQSLKIDCKNKEAQREKKLLESIIKNSLAEKLKLYKNNSKLM